MKRRKNEGTEVRNSRGTVKIRRDIILASGSLLSLFSLSLFSPSPFSMCSRLFVYILRMKSELGSFDMSPVAKTSKDKRVTRLRSVSPESSILHPSSLLAVAIRPIPVH